MQIRTIASRTTLVAALGGALALGLALPATASPVAAGAATHHAAAHVVHTAVTSSPRSTVVASGKKAVFKVKAAGSALHYQWYVRKAGSKHWVKISGARKSTYSVRTKHTLDGARYRVVVTGAHGKATSKAASLAVVVKPGVKAQPSTQFVATGTTATFHVTAKGGHLRYQWQRKLVGGSWKNLSGKTFTTLKVAAHTSLDGTQYRVTVSNKAGTTVSKAANLWVASSVADPFAVGQYIELGDWEIVSSGTQDVTTDAVAAGAHQPATGSRYQGLDVTVGYYGAGTADAQSRLKVVLVTRNGHVYDEGDAALKSTEALPIASNHYRNLVAPALVPTSELSGAAWRITDTKTGYAEYIAVK